MTFFYLLYEFFKTGLFSVGGGLATIPFLRAMGARYHWFDEALLSNMIAIGESTPGPIGVNMATYTGFTAGGAHGIWGAVSGSVIATLSLVTPSVIVIICVAKFLRAFSDNKRVKNAFYSIRPAVVGMIGASGVFIIKSALFSGAASVSTFEIKGALLFAALLFLTNKFKLHPIIYIISSGIIGAVFSL